MQIKKTSVTTSTASDMLTENIFDAGSHRSMPVLPDLDRNRSYVINKNNWHQNHPDDRENSRIHNEDNDINNEGTNHDSDSNLNDNGIDDNPTKLNSGYDISDKTNNRANGTDYDSDEFHSMAKNTKEYHTNHDNNKAFKNKSRNNRHYQNDKTYDKKDPNTMYSDAGSSNSRRNIKGNISSYINMENPNGVSSKNGHYQNVSNGTNEQNAMYNGTNSNNSGHNMNYNINSKPNRGSVNKRDQNVVHDTSEQSSISNDANFSDNGHNTQPNNMDSYNIAQNSFSSSHHNNKAYNNVKPNTSFSNRHHPDSNDEGNRKQFNGNKRHNNMKNAEYSGLKDEENLTDISSKTTNVTKGSKSNYNPKVDNNRVNNIAGPSNGFHSSGYNPNSNRADINYVNRRASQNQHQDNLRPDAYPFNCGKQYMVRDAVNDAVNINRLHNTNDNEWESATRFNYKDDTVNFGTNGNYSRLANRSNNRMDCSRRSLRQDNNNCCNKSIPLKRTDTREIVTRNGYIYEDYVKTQIRQWLEDVPLYLNQSEQERIKNEIVNNLTIEIISLGDRCKREQYEEKFKITVDKLLSSLPMWYPGQKSDQILFRNNLADNLFNKIKACIQNTKYKYTTTDPDSFINKNCKNDEIRNRMSLSDATEEELSNWVTAKTSTLPIKLDDATVTEILLKRLVPMLRDPVNPSTSKFNLKCAIAEVLNDLVGPHYSSRVNNIELYKLAEDLAIGLLAIQAQYEQDSHMASTAFQAPSVAHYSRQRESIIYREINKCLCATKFVFQDDIKSVIANIIINYFDPEAYISEVDVKEEILKELHRYCIPEACARHITQDILNEIKIALNQSNNFQTMCIPTIISKLSAFASEAMFSTFPVASTPKKRKSLNLNSRESLELNPEEIEYEEKVANLIRSWMETLPDFVIDDDEDIFKQTMVKDLAGEIVDQVKLEQIATIDEADNFRKHIVYRWVNKMNVYDINEIKEQIDEFLRKLKHIAIPLMTTPHRGNRQATQLREVNENFQEFHLPKSSHILEDEISIWMHAQPDIFDIDRVTRDKKILAIVDVLREKLPNKLPEEEILIDLTQWLDGIIKPENKDKIGQFASDLKKRIMMLPQDSTLANNFAKKEQERAEFFEEMDIKNKSCVPVKFTSTDEDTINIDNTMRQFISKYIEHNYDVDDPLARGAFSHLLKARLQRLNPPKRKEVYDKVEEARTNALLPRGKLMRELDYIKDVSDWLKNIAVAPSFNTTGNRNRIDFVNDLAHNILAIEEEREAKPNAMDYNLYLASVIGQFIDHIPIENEHHNSQYMNFIIKQLISKIMGHRNTNYNTFNNDESVDTSGVNNDNIGDFIEEFILLNGSDIADDELKLEAWSVRLLNEIKKMVHENALTKGEVYNQLLDVPKPGDETMKQFETEIEYIKEISQWIKNLPLLPINETEREERIKMINELTEKVTERDNMKLNNPNDTNAESEFAEYIAKWIGNLSLDESREVVVAVVIQQLLNRIEKVKSNFNESIQLAHPTIDSEHPIDNNLQPIETDKSTENQHPKHTTHVKKNKITKISHPISPATAMVDAIEQWSESLPITGNEKEVSFLKNDVSKKLYQTVGELNIDPRTFNDDLLYKNTLEDEVDAVIEKLPHNPELDSNKKQLKDEVVKFIVDAQQAIKENSASQHYKHRLEHTIEASMPHPVKNRQGFDPGFEIYKGRIADMFILDNFDHANDGVKVQYENTLKKEIKKYYPSVQNKNVVPLTNDEIYNELYGALFKVPVPNENSLRDEVEEIKTRCVIDMWYDKLPLIKTNNLSDLLELDKILAILAKRVHEIEKSSSSCDNKLNNEIKKWLGKLPLLPGQKKNIEYFARTLEKELKSSTNQRKCLTNDPANGKESKKGKTKSRFKDLSGIKSKPKKKAVDSLMAMVENWCLSLPIYSNRPQDADNDNILKDNLVTTIMIKLCELNMDPKIFSDDLLYDILLDEELDNVLRDVPKTCNFEDIKAQKKQQLKDAIRSIKPLFREEKTKHQYNQNLDNTVAKILVTSKDLTPRKEANLKNIKNDIVENFVQFTYDKGDDQSRQAHKIKIHDAVVKFLSEYKNDGKDPLMLRNKLICELTKVPEPAQDTLKEDVEEIRMKNVITKFFSEQAIDSNDDKMNQVKSSLAVKLNELEIDGHSPKNEAIMKKEITKYLKNLNVEVKPEAVDKFVNELKNDEWDRRPTKTIMEPCLSGQFCERDISPEDLQPKNKPDSGETCLKHNCPNGNNSKHKKLKRANVICECESESPTNTTIDCKCLQGMISPTHQYSCVCMNQKTISECFNQKMTFESMNQKTTCACLDQKNTCECMNQITDSIHSVDCRCKICDCAFELQRIAQRRQCMQFSQTNSKISFRMPAGYFYF